MFTTVKINNFRCLRELTFGTKKQPLRRVNLIAGENNAGKTALLEALFLHLGPTNPQLSINLNTFRGIESIDLDPASLWGWLFHRRDTRLQIELHSVSSDRVARNLELRLAEPEAGAIIPAGAEKGNGHRSTAAITTASPPRDLLLEFSDSTGQKGSTRVSVRDTGIQIKLGKIQKQFPMAVFLSTHFRVLKEDAERFSALEQVGREGELLPALKLLEPDLRRLAVSITGGVPLIHCDVGIGQLVPVPFMGEGFMRLLSIVLVIASAPDGWLLVDEIENGLHYSVMQAVWEAIAVASAKMKTQVFATTHSFECIQAAHRAFKMQSGRKKSYDFAYHRLDRTGDKVRVHTFDEEMLDAVENSDLEIR